MMIDKNKITQNFNKANYDLVADVQKSCALKLINQLQTNLPEFNPTSVLDIGTGTGYAANQLLSIFPNSSYSLNDISPNMLKLARKNLATCAKAQFILGDMETIDFADHQLVIANMSLQWANNLNALLKKLYNSSNVLAFSCLLDGTFNQWSKLFTELAIPSPIHQYPQSQELQNYLLSLNPTRYFFDVAEYTLEFASPDLFIQYLKNLGANYSTQEIPITSLRKILKNREKSLTISYKVFFAIIA